MEKKSPVRSSSDRDPLLVSVRSGARASMPGMMDTILNLGLNEQVVDVMRLNQATPLGMGLLQKIYSNVLRRCNSRKKYF